LNKLLGILIFSALLSTSVPVAGYAASSTPIKLSIDGKMQQSKVAPCKVDGNMMVPMQTIFASLGATLEFNKEKKQIKATKGDTVIELTVGSKTALLNSKKVALKAAPQILNGSTMVPLLFVAESLNATAVWDAKSNTVIVKQKPAVKASAEQTAKDEAEIQAIIYAHLNFFANKDAVGFRSVFEKPMESVEYLTKYFAENDGKYEDRIESIGDIQITGNEASAVIVKIHDIKEQIMGNAIYGAVRLKATFRVDLIKVNNVWKIKRFNHLSSLQIPVENEPNTTAVE